MLKEWLFRKLMQFSIFKVLLLLAFFMAWNPIDARSEIIWSGDYETGNFNQWHLRSGPPNFFLIPEYGRPPEGGGDGSLLEMVTSPVRQGRYAAKFTVKNSLNGKEPDDCDVTGCRNRRTEVTMHKNLPDVYNGLPYMSERWISVSHFVPSSWDTENGNGWGPLVFQIKPRNDQGGLSPKFSIQIKGNSWRLNHKWSPIENPNSADIPWQQSNNYASDRPRDDHDERDLRGDFPDVAVSQAALGNLNKGGWTDWIIHIKFDARGSQNGGTGFLRVWKRAGSGPWIHVLEIVPKVYTVRGEEYDRGIGYNSPPTSTDNGGFGIQAGLYMEKGQVWSLLRNRVVYNDNIKVGSEKVSFNIMSPDGSSPDALKSSVKPPENLRIK